MLDLLGKEVASMDDQLNQNTEIPADIKGFLQSLIDDAGMTFVDQSMHDEMLKELFVRLDHFITLKILDNLEPEQTETFIRMNEEKKSKEAIEQFLRDKIPNAQGVMTEALIEFRDKYLGNVAIARNAPGEEKETHRNDAAVQNLREKLHDRAHD